MKKVMLKESDEVDQAYLLLLYNPTLYLPGITPCSFCLISSGVINGNPDALTGFKSLPPVNAQTQKC